MTYSEALGKIETYPRVVSMGGHCHHRADPKPSCNIEDLCYKINSNCDTRNIIENLCHERELEIDYRGDDNDNFLAFTSRVRRTILPEKFEPLGISMYDSKQDLVRWLRCYSLAVQAAGGIDDTKGHLFPHMHGHYATYLARVPEA